MTEKPASSCLLCLQPNPDARLRLFCCHHAGGSATLFHQWVGRLPSHIELWAVQLSGRGDRALEPPLKRLVPIVQGIAEELVPHLKKPFAFFGHSMGAAIAFEIARLLRRRHAVQPAHLFVSGCEAPQRFDFTLPIYDLPDHDFIDKLRGLNGTPRTLLENPRLLRIVLPIIRADIEALQTYEYMADAALDCPITAVGGLQDQVVSLAGLMAWRNQTTAQFVAHVLPGDHFFLNSYQPLLLQILSEELGRIARER